MINESRRAHRRAAREPVPVLDVLTEEMLGRVGNISELGMLLVAHGQLQENAIYQLRFELAEATGRPRPIDVGAHVLWIGDANTPGQRWAGLRFLTISDPHVLALRQWIAHPGGAD